MAFKSNTHVPSVDSTREWIQQHPALDQAYSHNSSKAISKVANIMPSQLLAYNQFVISQHKLIVKQHLLNDINEIKNCGGHDMYYIFAELNSRGKLHELPVSPSHWQHNKLTKAEYSKLDPIEMEAYSKADHQ